jgi:hypothetical protein
MGYDLLCLVILAIKIGQLSGNKKLYCGYVREMTSTNVRNCSCLSACHITVFKYIYKNNRWIIISYQETNALITKIVVFRFTLQLSGNKKLYCGYVREMTSTNVRNCSVNLKTTIFVINALVSWYVCHGSDVCH